MIINVKRISPIGDVKKISPIGDLKSTIWTTVYSSYIANSKAMNFHHPLLIEAQVISFFSSFEKDGSLFRFFER